MKSKVNSSRILVKPAVELLQNPSTPFPPASRRPTLTHTYRGVQWDTGPEIGFDPPLNSSAGCPGAAGGGANVLISPRTCFLLGRRPPSIQKSAAPLEYTIWHICIIQRPLSYEILKVKSSKHKRFSSFHTKEASKYFSSASTIKLNYLPTVK